MYRGACLGLAWGFPGGFLGVRRGGPLETPRKDQRKSYRFLIIGKTSV